MNPDFSIITVAYNSERTIERTIKSVLSQSHKNFEYIIVDGGSTDNTNVIIKRYAQQFSNCITHVSEPDQGIYDAMNKGIALSNGLVVGLLNSDDYYFDTTLSIVYNFYLKSDRKTVLSGELIFKSGQKEQLLKTGNNRFRKKMNQFKNGVRHPATFVPKCIYNDVGLFDLSYKIASDAELMLRIDRANYKFSFINEPLVVMFDGGLSNSKGITRQILSEKKKILKAYCPNRAKRVFYMIETSLRFKVKEIASNLISIYRTIDN